MKIEYIRKAFEECGYTESVEELMMFAEFKCGVRPIKRLTFGANSSLDEEGFMEELKKFPEPFWGKIWLIDETFFLFNGYDWQHIDCKVPEDIDPTGAFLS